MPTSTRTLTTSVAARPRRAMPTPAARGTLLATIARCSPDGRVWLEGHSGPALLLATAGPLASGMRVLVQTAGDTLVIVGRVLDRQPAADGRLELAAEREVVIRSGAASLTLTSAGKAILAGEYVLSRSRGVNKIKGGSVQIN